MSLAAKHGLLHLLQPAEVGSLLRMGEVLYLSDSSMLQRSPSTVPDFIKSLMKPWKAVLLVECRQGHRLVHEVLEVTPPLAPLVVIAVKAEGRYEAIHSVLQGRTAPDRFLVALRRD